MDDGRAIMGRRRMLKSASAVNASPGQNLVLTVLCLDCLMCNLVLTVLCLVLTVLYLVLTVLCISTVEETRWTTGGPSWAGGGC